MPIINTKVAKHLEDIAKLIELTENEIELKKVFAYEKAADSIIQFPIDIRTVKPSSIKGIGSSIEKCILQFLQTGTSERYQELVKITPPPSVVELTKMGGVDLKMAKVIYQSYGIKNLEEFGQAIQKGIIKDSKLIQSYEFNQKQSNRILYQDAFAIVSPIFEALIQLDEIKKFSYAGSLRRKEPTVHNVNLLCATTNRGVVTTWFVKWAEETKDVIMQTNDKVIIKIKGLEIILDFCEEKEWGSRLFNLTGSVEFNLKNKATAKSKNMLLSEHGLVLPDGKVVTDSEENICKESGIPFLVPELRTLSGIVDIPNRLDLIDKKDISGDLHIHTSLSINSSGSVINYAKAAKELGYKYLAFTDNGKRTDGSGIDSSDLERQFEEIDQYKDIGIKLLKGIEVDIASNGTLYYSDKELSKFDIVIAGIHSDFDLDELRQTARLIQAIKNPAVKILVHPSCEEYLKRPSIKVKWDTVFEECVRNNVAIEITSNPTRIPLSPVLIWKAKQMGVKFVITSSAHSISTLSQIQYGITRARCGGICKEDLFQLC